MSGPIPPPILAAFDVEPLFQDTGITLALMGLLVVFAALLLVGLFIGLLPKAMGMLEKVAPEKATAAAAAATAAAAAATTAPPKPQAAPAAAADEPVPDEVLAVIAAVVAHTVRKPHRIVRTRDLTPDDKSWSMEGRLKQHASHRIQTRGKG